MRLRIGIDIDGVMYMWEKTARYMLREILPNSSYSKDGALGETSNGWDFIQNNVSENDWKWLWKEGVHLGLFRHGHLYPGTIKAIRRLAEIGDVVAITHRPKQAVHDTLAWLAYQNLPLSGLHLLTNSEPKSGVKPECHIYLDDKWENCSDLFENTSARVVCLMDRAWNQECCDPGIVRVHNWQQFIDQVEDLNDLAY